MPSTDSFSRTNEGRISKPEQAIDRLLYVYFQIGAKDRSGADDKLGLKLSQTRASDLNRNTHYFIDLQHLFAAVRPACA